MSSNLPTLDAAPQSTPMLCLGEAGAAPLPLINVSGAPTASDTAGWGGTLTGNASWLAQKPGWDIISCLLFGFPFGGDGPLG